MVKAVQKKKWLFAFVLGGLFVSISALSVSPQEKPVEIPADLQSDVVEINSLKEFKIVKTGTEVIPSISNEGIPYALIRFRGNLNPWSCAHFDEKANRPVRDLLALEKEFISDRRTETKILYAQRLSLRCIRKNPSGLHDVSQTGTAGVGGSQDFATTLKIRNFNALSASTREARFVFEVKQDNIKPEYGGERKVFTVKWTRDSGWSIQEK